VVTSVRHPVGMARVTFGGNRELSVKIGSPNGLQKGVGLHRLTFPTEFDARNTITGGVPVTLNVHAWLGASRGDWLGPLITDERGGGLRRGSPGPRTWWSA